MQPPAKSQLFGTLLAAPSLGKLSRLSNKKVSICFGAIALLAKLRFPAPAITTDKHSFVAEQSG